MKRQRAARASHIRTPLSLAALAFSIVLPNVPSIAALSNLPPDTSLPNRVFLRLPPMIAVQRMSSMFPLHRPDPVTPSSTRGVLHIKSKPQPQPSHPQAQPKSRGSPRSKPQQRRPPQSAAPVIVDKINPTSASPAKADPTLTSAEKSIRGRKHKSPKDAGRSDNSVSHSDVPARRHAHQPSPSRMLSPPQATVSADPFTDDVVVPLQDSRADGRFRSPPKLAQPSGELARRRQAHLGSPTPKTVFRGKFDKPGREIPPLQSIPLNFDVQPNRRASTDFTWDHMCDDSSADDSDISPPTTPIREISTVPSKKGTWQQGNFHDAPHTAPLASTFGYPFVRHNPCSTPTPAQRRRNHRRVPSEGVFVVSTDEDSSSSVSDLFESLHIKRHSPVSIPRQRCYTVPAGGSLSLDVVPSHILSSSAPAAAGYFAGSVFQNSPSPDDLPAPSFGL